jgi:hypothetical protein
VSTEQLEVVVRTAFAGTHRWPEAPVSRAYLANVHRHLFHVEACVSVDAGRDIEFHDLLDSVRRAIRTLGISAGAGGVALGSMSCEDIATVLAHELIAEHGSDRRIEVGVWEDGECGARYRSAP